MEFKVVVSEAGKTFQKEVKDEEANALLGLKIGDTFNGKLIGLEGKKLQITGGSDKDGFPMRKDVSGQRRIKILMGKGLGFKPEREGERRRKRVRGNVISEDIVQINTKVIEKKPKKIKKKEKKEIVEPKKKKPKIKREKPKKEIPITKVKGIGAKKATEFKKAGISTVSDLLKVSSEELASKTSFSKEYIEKLKESAKEVM